MNRLLFCMVMFALTVGCNKSIPDGQSADVTDPATALDYEDASDSSNINDGPLDATGELRRWKRSDVVGRTLVYAISENSESLHEFNDKGRLEIAMHRNGARVHSTSWSWKIDSKGVLVLECVGPKMIAKMKILNRLTNGFEIEQSGESGSETIPPNTIEWSYRAESD